jgi:hypothetical protein
MNIYRSSSHPTLEAFTYRLIYNNTFMLVAQMHRDPTVPIVITMCLRALRLHDYGTIVDHASTGVKLQYTSTSC